MNCPHCTKPNPEGVRSCLNCGHKFVTDNNQPDLNSLFYEFASYVDGIPMYKRSVEPKLRNIFSRVFRKHTDLEAERLFIVGTALTTPNIEEVKETWPKPWLFARVFLIALVAYLGLFLGVSLFRNINFLPGLIVVGAFTVPFTTLIFFWEMNAPQNIAIYRIIYVVLIGGILSMLVSLVFYDILRHNINPVTIGIVEELSKVITVIYFVKSLKYRYILNGVLLGAAVGAGFAAFETAGYALRTLLSGNFHTLYLTLFWRSILAPGGHVSWAALTGAAICMVQGDQRFRMGMMVKPTFGLMFVLVVAMHALWDSPWLGNFPFGQFILMFVSWFLVFIMIRKGLKQIADRKWELGYSQ